MDIQKIMKCLADSNRMKIIQLLSRRKYCVRALSGELGISEPAVSQHIRVLKEAELLEIDDKKSYHVHYAVKRETLELTARVFEQMAGEVVKERSCGGNCKKRVEETNEAEQNS